MVETKDIVKGYETSPGKYVVLEKDEVKAAAGDRGKVIHLEEFVAAEEIDPVFFEKTYYVGSRDDEDAYRLLFEALRKSERSGVGRFSFHDREYLVALRALDDVLAISHPALRRRGRRRRRPRDRGPGRKPSKREVEMAKRLVEIARRRTSIPPTTTTPIARRCST